MDAQQARIYTAIIITAIVLGLIIVFFALSIIRQQRRNYELNRKLILAEIATLESERARTAADLHDELGPLLSVIKFRVDYAKNNDEELEKASVHLDELIVRLREIANNLMPSALMNKGLCTAVNEFTRDTKISERLKIHLQCDDDFPLRDQNSIHLYRVIQEVVHNCLKHAEAQNLDIILKRGNSKVTLHCKDDGKGFDLGGTAAKGIGLNSMRNRTEMMGGSMRMESKLGVGTAVYLEIPYNKE